MAEELGISKDTVRTIVHKDLGKWKICSQVVPHKLTDKRKAKQMETFGGLITICDQDPFFLQTIIIGGETWCTSSICNQSSVPVLDHPPYSPDLATAEFFVSPA